MQAYIPETIDTQELIHYHADKAHPLFIKRLEDALDKDALIEQHEETQTSMYDAMDSAEKAADELAEILDYAAEGTGYHRGTDYFESLRAKKKQDREECLAEFTNELREKLGDIYNQLKAGKDC